MGEFVAAFSGGLSNPRGVTFGPDGNLYVAGYGSKNVLRYDGETGAFIDVFAEGGNPEGPSNLRFGPDGNLYLTSMDHDRNVLPIDDDRVLRYDGATGDYIDDYMPSLADGLWAPWGMFPWGLLFDADNNLLISGNNRVLRYGPMSTAAFTVTLSTPSESPVSVDFSTANNTAVGGSDYIAKSGTVVFEPGVTSKSIIIPTIDDATVEDNETFTVLLSNPTGGATIMDGEGLATIADPGETVFSDSFENGQWNGLWVEDSQNDWFTSTQRKTDGSYSAEVDGRATDATLTVASPIDLTPYGSAELTFDWYIESALDAGEYLAVDLFDGTTWTEVARLAGNVDAEDVWHQPWCDPAGVPGQQLPVPFPREDERIGRRCQRRQCPVGRYQPRCAKLAATSRRRCSHDRRRHGRHDRRAGQRLGSGRGRCPAGGSRDSGRTARSSTTVMGPSPTRRA